MLWVNNNLDIVATKYYYSIIRIFDKGEWLNMAKKDKIKAEQEFLKTYSSDAFEKPSVAVDLLVFTVEDGKLKIVTVRRQEYPFKGELALPGVFVGMTESVDDAAKRGIKEEAGLEDIYFEQLYAFGEIDRDPRMRVISIAYIALVPIEKIHLRTGLRSEKTELTDVDALLSSGEEVAFDHRQIIESGRERIRSKTESTSLPFNLMPEEFTLPELQKVYEILLGKKLYKANFRKKIAEMIVETDHMTSGDAHRPSRYYMFKG